MKPLWQRAINHRHIELEPEGEYASVGEEFAALRAKRKALLAFSGKASRAQRKRRAKERRARANP
jgi:hypothetical protein